MGFTLLHDNQTFYISCTNTPIIFAKNNRENFTISVQFDYYILEDGNRINKNNIMKSIHFPCQINGLEQIKTNFLSIVYNKFKQNNNDIDLADFNEPIDYYE